MKPNFYTESILYWLARGTSALAQRLPASWNTAAGAAGGAVLYHCLPKRRAVALGNLRAAFGEAYSPEEYRRILRELFMNFGRTFAEVAAIPRIDRAYVDRWVAIEPGSRERLEKALAKGKGVIFLTGHFGNWELAPITAALHGYPTLVLAREQGWPRLNRLLTQYRESKGCKVVTKGFPVRELIEGLKKGKLAGILADQDGGKNGVLTDFFGRLASTAPGTVALSLNTGAPILPFFLVRTRGAAHLLTLEEPLAIPEEGPIEERIRAGVEAYIKRIEKAVRQHPGQWLWMHRRWKTTPDRRLLIFSDGKAGHLKQSQALAARLEAAWKEKISGDLRLQGIRRPMVSVQTVEVAYRGRLARLLLTAAASLAPRRFSGGDRWLRWALAPSSYRAIASLHADYSISCGAATAPVNLLWAWGICARPIHITRARLPSWRRFDLAVFPRHDRPPQPAPPNLLVIDGALAAPGQPDAGREEGWRRSLGLARPRRIGLMLGGPARGTALPWAQVQGAVRSLLQATDRMDAELLVTSSRRTPPEVEEGLQALLKGHPRCRLLSLVNREDAGGLPSTSEAADCILGLASVLVISGDSISMVSEALARARPVVSFLPEKSGRMSGATKYERFLRSLDEQGRVTLVPAGGVGEAVAAAVERAAASVPVVPVSDPVEEFLRRWL